MKRFLALVLVSCLLAAPALAAKQETKPASVKGRAAIAATVNDEVITVADLENRMRLYLLGTPGQPPPEILERMRAQALDRMIDEKLQMGAAKGLGISVPDSKVVEAFAQVAAQNNLAPEEFKKNLISSGVQISTLNEQLRAEIAWGQVVLRKLRPDITVSESDIDSQMEQTARNRSKPQYHVAEIYLSVPGTAQDEAVRRDAEKLAEQIVKGARFSDIARAFSQAPGAASGGDLGWVQEGQLDQRLDAALKQMQPGQICPPVRTDGGYHILFLRDVRQPAEVYGPSAAPDKDNQAARDDIANKIGMQRLEQMQARYLLDLRATAFIEKRV